ncbi:uncharacterized protein LOC129592304 [Paramacrobiotus metropolitanus]|uniref:uncharacterized protein LOC129592304 n=1 Tax=Paramacrobiotus metropolitanus TaxID=2943436 RepID=UPI0024458725|nr:uncharacterized protein LOC129592304 [Paramacrobiotus metropolitanus]
MANKQALLTTSAVLLSVAMMLCSYSYTDATPVTANKAIHQDISLEPEVTNRTSKRTGKPMPYELSNSTWIIESSGSINCIHPETPIVWILGSTWTFMDKSDTINRTCPGGFHYQGCPFTLRLAHECSGFKGNCPFKPVKPDEESRCPTTHFNFAYQCLPEPTADKPLKSYAVAPKNADPNDPCLPLYVAKHTGVAGH